MGKQRLRPPSLTEPLPFPVFGLTWDGAPSSARRDGYSVVAYCGGGGSAKTGVGNKVVVTVAADEAPPPADGGEGAGDGGNNAPSFSTRQIQISTGEALCFGVKLFRPHDDALQMVRLLACIGDEVLLYGIPLRRDDSASGDNKENDDEEEEAEEEAILLGKTNVGKGYGANVAAYSPFHKEGRLVHHVAVGCENGTTVVYRLEQLDAVGGNPSFEFVPVAECRGHTKALCAVNFHPRGTQLLTSAKDGTARLFDVPSGGELAVLKCEVHDPNGPPPVPPAPTVQTKDPRMMKRPPQILVRGCAYGDLEGKVMYTVASGKRGPAYLAKWKALAPLNQAGGPPGAPSEPVPISVNQEYRIQCSPVPISAMALSSDGTLLTLGSVEGSVALYDLETKRAVKQFAEVHDLPVTCVASRPIPSALMLPGELEGGVSFDALSASADNKLGRWTLQKRSRIKVAKQRSPPRKVGAVERWIWSMLRIPLLLLFLLVLAAIREAMEICGEQFGLSALVMEPGRAGHCLYREVLWAEPGRVSFVPE
ncbi:hypothetical protein ACHAXT_013094 [Thalassiosira profunda]